MTPQPESAVAAVETLRGQLDTLNGALDSIDRKAALIPAILGALAGILIVPDPAPTPLQKSLVILGLLMVVISVGLALRVLWARLITVGPNAQQVANGTHLDPADFNRAVAGSLANSIDSLSTVSEWKAHRLNVAMLFASATTVVLAIARFIGG